MTELKPDGPALMEQAAAEPTLDELMQRDPRNVSDDDLKILVSHLRHRRAAFIAAESKKKDKKAGVGQQEEE